MDQAFFARVRDLYNRIFGALGDHWRDCGVCRDQCHGRGRDRRREIGTLRALGTLPSQLLRTLALEGMVLGGKVPWWARHWRWAPRCFCTWFRSTCHHPRARSVGYPLTIAIDAGMQRGDLGGHGAADHGGIELGGTQDRAPAGGGCSAHT